MIDKILEFSLRQRAFVLLGAFGLMAVGAWSAARLPIDAQPDITNVQVQINTAVPALAPEEVEKLVSYPIEAEMGGIERLTEVRSISKSGLSQITLIFEDGADIYRARQLVGERLQSVLEELPRGLVPKLAPITTGMGEIFHYTVRYRPGAKEAPADPVAAERQLMLTQEYIVKPALRTVPGVAEVNTSGGYDTEVVVTPDPAKLASVGLTVAELAEVIGENTANAGGSVVEKGAENVTVRSLGRVQNAAEIAALPLKFSGRTRAVRVADVAEVSIASSVRTGSATRDGEEAVLGSTLMLTGENSRLVSRRVHAAVDALQAKMPAGMMLETLYDRSDLVDATIETVEHNLFEGALLVIAVLIGLLGNWRAGMIVASAIPLSLLFAVSGMVRYGVSGNLMSLGAVDFGLIVDGAVVMAENVVRMLGERQHHLGRLLTGEERRHTILTACKQVGTPTVFGVAIITIVYLPILALTGIEGKMFRPMALTVVFALIGALLVALTVVPVLCSLFLTKRVSERENAAIRLAKRLYAPALRGALRLRWLLVGVAAAIFVLSIWTFNRLGAEFVPQLDEGSLAINFIRPPSISLTAAVEMQTASERRLLADFPEITHAFARIGTSEVATDPMGADSADSYVLLRPKSQWRQENGRRITRDELIAKMADDLKTHFPAQSFLFSQPIQMRMNELLEGTRADVAIKVFGEDYDTLEKISDAVRDLVQKIPGAADVDFDAIGKGPVFQVVMNRAAMNRYNVHAADVNKEIAAAFAGDDAGAIIDGNRRFPIVTRLSDGERRRLTSVGNLPVRTSEGGLIRLGQVADMGLEQSVNAINREAFQRRIAILVNLRGRDVDSFVRDAQAQIAAKVPLPPGYTIEYGGQFKNLREARLRLAIVVPTALVLIFLLIFMAFGSIRQALIVYTGIPLAVTGGVFSLWLRGMPFSISAGVGFIALSGVAVLNGVMMISFFNQLRQEGKPVREAVLEGALTRLRPVLMTALVASLGFVPMALATGSGAEVQRPLATVVIGGILSATFLTLGLLPALYDAFERD
ncbi:MAG TPA: CusA/CzcA family heavy metal efflux RND transporter [Bryobacteraceae bacterium]|nr:CusA/CzcA family heavy metal efflux RND transporter [Bryobacteraceae bacterium]